MAIVTMDKTLFDLSLSGVVSLLVSSSSIGVESEGKKVEFKSLHYSADKVFKLILDIDGGEQEIENPQFKFDSVKSEIYIDFDESLYSFRFYSENLVNFCTLKHLLQ